MAHRSLAIDPPTETLVPLHTAVRLLRIMLSINLVLAIVGIVFPGLYFGMGASVLVALTSWPTALAWVFVMLPGLTRRFAFPAAPCYDRRAVISGVDDEETTNATRCQE